MIPVKFIRGEEWPCGVERRVSPWPSSQVLGVLNAQTELSDWEVGSIHSDQCAGDFKMISGCPCVGAEAADLILVSRQETLENLIARQMQPDGETPIACAFLVADMTPTEKHAILSMWVDDQIETESVVISQTWSEAHRLRWEMAAFRSEEARHQMAVAIAHFDVMSEQCIEAVLAKSPVLHREIEVSSALPALAGASLRVLLFGNWQKQENHNVMQ